MIEAITEFCPRFRIGSVVLDPYWPDSSSVRHTCSVIYTHFKHERYAFSVRKRSHLIFFFRPKLTNGYNNEKIKWTSFSFYLR